MGGLGHDALRWSPTRTSSRSADAGGRAVLVPPSPTTREEILAVLDGLLLAGGADIDPERTASRPTPRPPGCAPTATQASLASSRVPSRSDLPVLGICRGMQLMTVNAGGHLHQHLPERRRPRGPPARRRGRTASTRYASTQPRACRRSWDRAYTCRSYHHQGVTDAGQLTVTAWAEDDGTIEAVEDPGHRFAIGVLWHPEVGEDPRLFEALVARRAGRHGHRVCTILVAWQWRLDVPLVLAANRDELDRAADRPADAAEPVARDLGRA